MEDISVVPVAAAAAAQESTGGDGAATSLSEEEVTRRLNAENGALRRWLLGFVIVNFEIDYGQVIELVYPHDIVFDKAESTTLSFLSFPDSNATALGDTIYTFKVNSLPSLCSTPVYAYTFFRQQKDQSQKRGFLQKSVVLLSHLPYIALFETAARVLGTLFFEHGESILEVAAHNIATWPAPAPGLSLELPFAGSVLVATLPQKYLTEEAIPTSPGSSPVVPAKSLEEPLQPPHPRTLGLATPPKGFHVTILVDGCNCDRAYPLQEVNLYDCLQSMLPDLWTLWELVLTAQPLVIISPTPDQCSHAVLSLASLIAPLAYEGDLRPYFTVHDADFKDFTAPPPADEKTLTRPVMIGVTNPYFLKAMEHWPHIVSIGKFDKLHQFLSPSKTGSPTKSKPEELQLKHKALTPPQPNMLKRLLKPTGDLKQISTINNLMLRQHFVERTEQFLRPLEIFFHSFVDKLSREISPLRAPPSVQFFPEDEFVKFLQTYQGPAAIKHKSEIELYRKFIHNANFRPWFDLRWNTSMGRLHSLYRNALCCMDTDAVCRSLPVATAQKTLTDLCLRIQQALQRERERAQPAADVILTLRSHLAEFLACLPADLRQAITELA
eukprot:TRINITY_DN1996_c0_g1_i4.p1 TRINITY_DN1996_c0_g1~~TRINITY_DN1996_c0_g1_i4.p1  ORF type:complete len:636 (-),score=120.47 TRINITY_DN1996_c0_g1_i4:1235-3064(-)